MTDLDLLRLKAEIHALKLLLPPCLTFLASQFPDPASFLSEIEANAIEAIRQAALSYTTNKNYQADFVQLASGW